MCRYARSIQCLAAVSFLLFYFTDHTRGKCAASILGCCVCCCLKFSHWIHMAFCLLVFSSSIDASVLVLYSFFFFVFSFISISSGAHTHNHALSWSFLIACKIWFYCWCGVAAHIMFMCARWRFVFSLFLTAAKYPQNRQCRAAQFTVDASSVETWWKAFAVNGTSGMDEKWCVIPSSLRVCVCVCSAFWHVRITISRSTFVVRYLQFTRLLKLFNYFNLIAALKLVPKGI